jgi:putative transposase
VTHRVIQHYGVQFSSLRYNSSELTLLRTRLKGEKAKVKYHPADLSHLYVYDPFDNRYIDVPALDQEYTQGLSLWKHRIIRRVARSEYDAVDLVALGRAKRKIQEIVEAGRSRKRLSTRKRIARWEASGKPTRQVESEQKVDEPLALIGEGTSDTQPLVILDLDLEDLEEEGWDVSYELPRGRP